MKRIEVTSAKMTKNSSLERETLINYVIAKAMSDPKIKILVTASEPSELAEFYSVVKKTVRKFAYFNIDLFDCKYSEQPSMSQITFKNKSRIDFLVVCPNKFRGCKYDVVIMLSSSTIPDDIFKLCILPLLRRDEDEKILIREDLWNKQNEPNAKDTEEGDK
jgi:hypothetical protein